MVLFFMSILFSWIACCCTSLSYFLFIASYSFVAWLFSEKSLFILMPVIWYILLCVHESACIILVFMMWIISSCCIYVIIKEEICMLCCSMQIYWLFHSATVQVLYELFSLVDKGAFSDYTQKNRKQKSLILKKRGKKLQFRI